MNIVIVIDLIDTLTNGSVITARRFADGLKKRGHAVKIVAVGADGENDCPVKERYFPLLSKVSAKNQIRFAKFDKIKIKNAFTGADVVHFIFPFKFERQCKRLADSMNIPTTAAFHVQPENISYNAHLGKSRLFNSLLYGYLRRSFYKNFSRIHCPSQFIANRLISRGYGGKMYVISNGCDPSFKPAERAERTGKFEIVMVGRLSPEKNQKTLIKAIGQSFHRDKISLTLAGNGSLKSRLRRQAAREHVDVKFGFFSKEQLVEKLQESDLYVHAAKVEIEAIACIEAISCGLVPVIMNSPLSATPQFALDERSLFTDADSLTERIDYWYENKAERERMSNVYAEYAKRFRLEKSLEQAEEMFEDQINENKSAVR